MALLSFSPQDIGWGQVTVNVPPERFLSIGRYWRAKLELTLNAMIAEGDSTNPYFARSRDRVAQSISEAVLGRQEEEQRQAGLSMRGGVETSLSTDKLEEIGGAIVQGEGLNGVLNKLASGWGAGLGAGDEISEVTAGITWDEDYCIFSISCKLVKQFGANGQETGARLRTEYGGTIKIGLSEAGWAFLIGRVATRLPAAVRFAQALNAFFQPLRSRLATAIAARGLAVSPRLGGFLGSFGSACSIWMWAITLGFAVRDLSVWICRRAWEAGVRRGTCVTYCNSFCRTIFGYEPVFENYVPHIREVQTRAQSHARAIIERGNRLAAQAWLMNSFGETMVSVRSSDDANLIGTRMGMDMDRSGLRETQYLEELRSFIDVWRAAL